MLKSFLLTTIAAATKGIVTRAEPSNFHKKIRATGGGQVKCERKNSERTKGINAIACGH